jgi:uncharacterized membrane protein YccC
MSRAPSWAQSDHLPRLRHRLRAGLARLRDEGWSILQTAIAASAAWYLAALVLRVERPFYAAVAAIVTLGVTFGQRGVRAIEVVLGVVFGLTIATLLVLAIGTGTLQIGVVVALAAALAVFLGGKPLLVTQTAVSAMLVVALEPSGAGFTPDRFLEALIGSGVALVVNSLLPVNPERAVERAVHPILSDLVATLEEVAAALSESDLERAERALLKAREIDERVEGFKETLAAGHETARFAPPRRRALRHLELYAAAASRIDLVVVDTRAVARAAVRAVRHGCPASEPLSEAVLDLARAVEALSTYLEKLGPAEEVRRFALKAAGEASALLEEYHDLATSVVVGDIRDTAMDLLTGTGMDRAEALRELEEAISRASEAG